MPTLAIVKTYVNGAVLTETDLDNIKTSVESFLNTTKIDSANIQTSGVITANLAPAAVIDSKIDSSVTRESKQITNLGISATVAANALTIALKDSAGTDPTVSSQVKIGFRNATAGTGTFSQRTISTGIPLVISSGSTLGHASGVNHYIYVYLLDNAGTIEEAASSTLFDEGSIQSTTAEGGIGGADSNAVLYSTTARTNVPIHLIGRIKSNQAVAGTWTTAPSEISLLPFDKEKISLRYTTAAGQSIPTATDTTINFNTKEYDSHNAVITGVSWKFTAPKTRKYIITGAIRYDSVSYAAGDSNTFQLFVNSSLYAYFDILTFETAVIFTASMIGGSIIVPLIVGDIVELKTSTGAAGGGSLQALSTVNYISINEI